jgi:hypothetical protein
VKGNERATQAAIAIARAIGVFDQPANDTTQEKEDYLTDETLENLSVSALKELLEIEENKKRSN